MTARDPLPVRIPLLHPSRHVQLHRQHSIQTFEEYEGATIFMETCVALPITTACLVIALQYNRYESDCDNDHFIIGLPTFLWAAGFSQIGMILMAYCSYCCDLYLCFQCIVCLANIYYFTWAGLGLHIFIDQMSEQCQKESIGTMVFAWSLIQVCLNPLEFTIWIMIRFCGYTDHRKRIGLLFCLLL